MQQIANSRPLTLAQMQANPMTMIPPDWSDMVSFFYMANSHILRDTLAVCARFKLWIEQGLEIQDAQVAIQSLMTPEASARFQYAGQLLAELSLAVAEAIKRKRERERQERMQREADDAARASVGVVSNLAEMFRGVN